MIASSRKRYLTEIDTVPACFFIVRDERMKSRNKKILIEIAVIALAVVIFAAVVLVDTLQSRPSVFLSKEQSQEIINQTKEKIPSITSPCAKYITSETQIEVLSVKQGEGREMIVHCNFSTVDVKEIYTQNKDSLFNSAYEFYINQTEASEIKKSPNATKIRQHLDDDMMALLEEAPRISGEYDIYIYELEVIPEKDAFTVKVDDAIFRVYLSDEMVNAVFGGLVFVRDDIANTSKISYNDETIDIGKLSTLRTGVDECFKLKDFIADKPDTSPYFLNLWNGFCKDFHTNFIEEARWKHLTNGIVSTLGITLFAAVLGVFVGFLCAIIRVTHDKTGKLMVPDQIVRAYLAIIRGTPAMIQLLIIYFVILLPIGVEKLPAAIICFGLNSGAYVAEIVRGGIMSVDNGQVEAGRSLGLNYIQTMYHIVVPQAFKAVLPSLANEFITLLKESSVAFYIGVKDLTQGGLAIRSDTSNSFLPLIAVALCYFIIVMILTKLVKKLERRLRKDER